MRAYYDSSSITYKDKNLEKYFDENIKIKTWLKVEAALANAQAEVGMIPKEAASIINQKANIKYLDLNEMEDIKKEIGHGFLPFVKVFSKACGNFAGKFVHYGATTQNIQQTSQLYILKNITIEFKKKLGLILSNLSNLAENNKDTVMPGRTHAKHAIPITFGFKVGVWIYELMEAIEILEDAEDRIYQVMMGGAIGAFNSMPVNGKKIQHLVAKQLGMKEMLIPSRNINVHKLEYIYAISQIANVLHKIAEEIYYGGLEEMGELFEPFKKGTMGSSTMPHKINPKLAKGIISNASKLYSLLEPGFYSNVRVFEGDSSQYLLFDGLLDEVLDLMNEVLIRSVPLTEGLVVDKQKMYSNALIDSGLMNLEYIMMDLAKKVGKDKAHSMMYQIAMKVKFEDKNLFDLLRQEPQLKDESDNYILELIKVENYTGISEEIALESAERAKKKSKELLLLQSDL
ncbi:adenylosuccinate lyase [Ignavigranum ruoffiae]|uniref:Adenylosuccinate lyase n=1 Tax=Ignavigranum ruoffiae TaxID=89093 RepID=A0A1H9B6I9_9LACT|nr:adenylosuccinate lyase family protein [Ignavigranum ruoffiae]SEP84670.1 adenylosuccinate lyase [Ignavigranum ruoffiae]